MSGSASSHACTIRGVAVTATFHYVSRTFGEASLDRVLGELGEKYAGVLDADLLLSDQLDERRVVPVRLIVDVIERAGELYLKDQGGPAALADASGAYAAYEAQPLLRRLIQNLASPESLVRGAASLWKHYYGCGSLVAEQPGPQQVHVVVSGLHDAHPLWCRRLAAYFREALRRSSGRAARMTEVACVFEGADACVFEGDWSGASLF
ncbi:MAG: hypothetical protein AB7O37_04995 [Vicinamibacteria bacterium]